MNILKLITLVIQKDCWMIIVLNMMHGQAFTKLHFHCMDHRTLCTKM